MRDLFDLAADAAFACLAGGELATLWFEAEDSQFVRLNGARIRQAGSVQRPLATLRLILGARQASETLVLTGQPGEDTTRVQAAIAALRDVLSDSADDPHLLVARGALHSEARAELRAPDAFELGERIARLARGLDLVGFIASGPIARGFASATAAGREVSHWFDTCSASVDFSIHRPPDRAVKAQLAGDAASGLLADSAIEAELQRSARLSEWLDLPPVDVRPGRHRVLLEPAATAELLGMAEWSGFSVRAHRTRNSPLARFHDGEVAFDPRVTLTEEPAAGGAPRFQSDGYLMPPRLSLIEAGRRASLLVSPRSEREFGVPANGAPASESPTALRLAPGDLPDEDALRALDTGLWVSNLWYLNWSDRLGARVTGMTRFACFWVRNGKVAGPVAPLRFDDSVYRIFGSELEALGAQPRWMPDTSTYDARSTGSVSAPSMLLRSLAVVL